MGVRAGQAAALGAASGVGFSNESDISGIATDAAIGGALGGGLQFGLDGLGKVARNMANPSPAKA